MVVDDEVGTLPDAEWFEHALVLVQWLVVALEHPGTELMLLGVGSAGAAPGGGPGGGGDGAARRGGDGGGRLGAMSGCYV